MSLSIALSFRHAVGVGKTTSQKPIVRGRCVTPVVASDRQQSNLDSARLSVKRVAVAGLVALHLAITASPVFAGEEVFNDRASQKAAILAAARAKAAAGAAQPAAPPAAMENSAAQFKSVEGFMDKDVRASQAVRQTEEGEAYGAATFEVTETLAEVAAPEEPEPENVNQGGGLFGMFN